MKRYIAISLLVLVFGFVLYDNHKKSDMISAYSELETACDQLVSLQEENLSLQSEIIEKQEFLLSN